MNDTDRIIVVATAVTVTKICVCLLCALLLLFVFALLSKAVPTCLDLEVHIEALDL